MFEDDAAAFRVLCGNYGVKRNGTIYRLDAKRKPTAAEENALDYLFHEWDYCYEPMVRP